MESLDKRLHYLRNGVYERGDVITKEFIDQLLDEVISKYGLEKGSTIIFGIIESRLDNRIAARYVSEMKDYVQGDMLLISQAIKKGFDINKAIDFETLKRENIATLFEALDKYYESIRDKADREKRVYFYDTNTYIANTEKEQKRLKDKIDKYNRDLKQTLYFTDLNSNEEVALKDYIEKIKVEIKKKEELEKMKKFENKKEQLDSNSTLLNTVTDSYNQGNGMGF